MGSGVVVQAVGHGPDSIQGATKSGRVASLESIVSAIEKGWWVLRPVAVRFMVL